MDIKKQSIENVKKLGYPVYMDSEYCIEYINKHGNCEKCEYSFSCDEVLLDILRNRVNIYKEVLIEDAEIPDPIDLKDCKVHRNIFNNCNGCKNEDKCYLMALTKYAYLQK
jgi:hypothetical protein